MGVERDDDEWPGGGFSEWRRSCDGLAEWERAAGPRGAARAAGRRGRRWRRRVVVSGALVVAVLCLAASWAAPALTPPAPPAGPAPGSGRFPLGGAPVAVGEWAWLPAGGTCRRDGETGGSWSVADLLGLGSGGAQPAADAAA
ncbi:hypothetical protein MF672_021345 [Actinomadura sp. ATCC 31491]|uniref:Uncharacterized protein n=1 Tax=Actinomadura luzonensis TaxID=2805427 RepID=A0ABT0FVG7_9ACTN|nr:hypothetical protein [Actinomadura luzonensis]MCK2216327.1 hypothetical protein [Actinomadura luzonensis]